jgi:hypothetical protein
LAGSCFGYGIRSDLPFSFVREGGGEPLMIDAAPGIPRPDGPPLIRWEPRPDHPFEAELHDGGEGTYRFWVDGVGTFGVRPGRRAITMPAEGEPIRREERLWGIPAVLCFLERGDHSLHAGAVQIGESAIVFGAPGRFGKTTLASAFVAAGFRLLSEDSTCLRPGATPAVLPGPAMLRVRPDSYDALSIGGTRVLDRDPDRVHLALDPATRGDGEPVPLAGVIMLRTHDDDAIDLTPVPPDAAIQDLWTLSFHPPTDEGRAACFERVVALAASVPMWNLTRRLRYDSLDAVVDTIAQAVRT